MSGGEDQKPVHDFEGSLVKKLQSDLSAARRAQDDITQGSRLYWQRVQAVHQAVLMLLEVRSVSALISRLQEEAIHPLGCDAAQLFLKAAGAQAQLAPPMPGCLAALTAPAILEDAARLEQCFPASSGTFAAALALPFAGADVQGCLVLAARDPSRFEAGQAHEPFLFLAQVVERLIGRTIQGNE